MATSTIEQIRQHSEDLELLEKSISKLLELRANKSNRKIVIEYLIADLVDKIYSKSKIVLALYKDEDGLRKREIAALAGLEKRKLIEEDTKDAQRPDVAIWTNFYAKLKEVKDYSRRNMSSTSGAYLIPPATGNITVDSELWIQELIKTEGPIVEQKFGNEEDLGRRVDLERLYVIFTNLKKYRMYRESEHRRNEIARLQRKKESNKGISDEIIAKIAVKCDASAIYIDYVTYLKTFHKFDAIPRYCKYRETEYVEYLKQLYEYLKDFYSRQNPLNYNQDIDRKLCDLFEAKWKNGEYWGGYTHKEKYYSLPADKLFITEGTFLNHKKSKKYNQLLANLQMKSISEQEMLIEKSEDHDKDIARLEHYIQGYSDLLSDTISHTIEYLQKKQSRTLKELMEESSWAQSHEGEEEKHDTGILDNESDGESDDDKPIYNPLNLPLGWDNKPIPYWLYKLHGLGQEFKCEICGNYSYWGRRAFERHFQEWRHAFGMLCLKIPNTAHFKEVTSIEAAISLYEKLKHEAVIQSFRTDFDMECEDQDGNVMSARAYDDLLRQGVI